MRDRSSVSIRNYRPDDLETCRAPWVELTEWHRHIYASPEIGGADPGRRFDEHLDRVGHERMWLATIKGEVVGMVGLLPGESESELEPIVVTDRWRGRGIGRELAEHVIAEAAAVGARQLLTRPVARNGAAIRFFHGLGFDALGQLELLLDLRPPDEERWRRGPMIAECDFRV
jgi:GNAT superfamily N-acetyltransferase